MLNGKELAFVVGQAGPLVDDEHSRALAGDGVVANVEAFEGDAVVLVFDGLFDQGGENETTGKQS